MSDDDATDLRALVQQQQQMMEQLQAEISTLRVTATNAAATTPAMPARAPSPVPRSSEPKTSPPPTFDGTKPRECRPFLNHCRINFQTQPSRFSSEQAKVFYTIGYLRGPAFELVAPFLDESRQSARPTWLDSFSSFADSLNSVFGVIDEAQQAERQLRDLRQTGSVSQYYTRFFALTPMLNWDDRALRSQFYFGLKPAIKDELTHHERPTTLEELKALAIRVDNRLFERLQERRNEREVVTGFSNSTQRPTVATQSGGFPSFHPATTPGPVPMDIDAVNTAAPRGPLSPQEKQRRRQLNLCLYCGQPNHMAYACPLKPRHRTQTAAVELASDSGHDNSSPEN
jgi:hypothetical protein